MVAVAVAMPPHGVVSPRMSCTTYAPTVTAEARAAAPMIWPTIKVFSVRFCNTARSCGLSAVSVTSAELSLHTEQRSEA